MNDTTANKLFEQALSKIESASIREWASNAHNRPVFLEWIKAPAAGFPPPLDADKVALYIVANAIGLW